MPDAWEGFEDLGDFRIGRSIGICTGKVFFHA